MRYFITRGLADDEYCLLFSFGSPLLHSNELATYGHGLDFFHPGKTWQIGSKALVRPLKILLAISAMVIELLIFTTAC